jgi:hypothetical protein
MMDMSGMSTAMMFGMGVIGSLSWRSQCSGSLLEDRVKQEQRTYSRAGLMMGRLNPADMWRPARQASRFWRRNNSLPSGTRR